MEKTVAKTFVIRAISLFALLALTLSGILSAAQETAVAACAGFVVSSFILMFNPVGYEGAAPSIPFAAGLAAVSILLSFTPVCRGDICLVMTLASMCAALGYGVFRAVDKYSNVRTLFRMDAIWCSVEDYARMFYMLVLCTVSVSALTACRYEAPAWVFIVVLIMQAALYVLLYRRAYTGRTILLGLRRESAIRDIIRGNLRSVPEYGGPDEHMNSVYAKVLKYMESRKPYLSEGFTIEDLASAVFTNKVYLSKAINYFSGRNFRQFVNYYRVMYATNIMKNDKHLKILDVSMMCGFHSVVTFNMAFKLYMNMTPSAYYSIVRDGANGTDVPQLAPAV